MNVGWRQERASEELLMGPSLLASVRGRMARNYGARRGTITAAFALAKRDVWLLEREILRMLAAERT